MRDTGRYLDDLHVGDVHVSYARTVTEAHLVQFTAFAGMQLPWFIDHDYASRQAPFHTPIVPGFLTASLSGGMLERVLGEGVLAGLGMDGLVFRAPVRPGDTVHAEVLIQETRATREPDRGVLRVQVDMLNQHDDIVLSYQATLLMKRRGGHQPEPGRKTAV